MTSHMSASKPFSSVAEAIAYGEEVFSQVFAVSNQPTGRPRYQKRPVCTLSEAQAIVTNREEDKRKKELARKDTKSKGKNLVSTPADQPPVLPGAVIGSHNEASPFWLYTEVRDEGGSRGEGVGRSIIKVWRQCSVSTIDQFGQTNMLT